MFDELRLAIRLARREMRQGLSGFGVFLLCLGLGVAVITGVGSVSASFLDGIAADARALHGGDVAVRLTYRQASPKEKTFLQQTGIMSETVSMRAMVWKPEAGDEFGKRTLVSLKAVDAYYPLYGRAILSPAMSLHSALEEHDGIFGAVVQREVLSRLGAQRGDIIHIGDGRFRISAILVKEPDNVVSFAGFGPRMLVSMPSMEQTGLLQPGSLIRRNYRVKLPENISAKSFAESLKTAFPEAGWRVTTADEAAPGLQRFFNNMSSILGLVGLSTLLLGGLGVAGAVAGYLESKTYSIATMKSVGASGRLVITVFLLQIILLALIGISVGLVIGALLPFLLSPLLSGIVPVSLKPGLHPVVLSIATSFGILTALAFSLPHLGSAARVSPLVLFRGYAAPKRLLPGRKTLLATGFAGLGIAGLVLVSIADKRLAWGFLGAVVLCILLFRLVITVLLVVLRAIPRPKHPLLSLALSGLTRPGNPTSGVLASIGLGLTVLCALTLVNANFNDRFQREIPAMAPAFFFIDIQPHQREAFIDAVSHINGVIKYETSPTLRGRIVDINDTPIEHIDYSPDVEWAVRGDRGLTFSASPPEHAEITSGTWWAPDYSGPPLASMTEDVAEGLGIRVGDTVTLNILGKDITVRVTSLRRVNWLSLGINHVFVLSPGLIETFPLTYIATVYTSKDIVDADENVFNTVTSTFPNITAIKVADALQTVKDIAETIVATVGTAAGVTLFAGILVLSQSLRAEMRRKAYETVIFKVCGATRKTILSILLLEYALIGAAAGLAALILGGILSAAFVSVFMELPFTFFIGPAILAVLAGAGLTMAMGLASAWRTLSQSSAPFLRNE
ncbi:ABC transporter permease [Desulfovibrio inopinatus]|uniref:ABC transporter permease n=1 Tax=Desulfovibrio inopinatus TaxID=102109 RepID=UPI0004097741|nr:FtsX-like permease family protein [Desulfovibrio inopinatus]